NTRPPPTYKLFPYTTLFRSNQVELVEVVLNSLLNIIKKGLTITERDVIYAIQLAKDGKINQFETLFEDEITKNARGKSIRVKTLDRKSTRLNSSHVSISYAV